MVPCLQAYELREAGAVLHSHSMNAVLATLLDPTAKEFRVTNLEMVKVGLDLAWLVAKVHAACCLPHASSDLCPTVAGSFQCSKPSCFAGWLPLLEVRVAGWLCLDSLISRGAFTAGNCWRRLL